MSSWNLQSCHHAGLVHPEPVVRTKLEQSWGFASRYGPGTLGNLVTVQLDLPGSSSLIRCPASVGHVAVDGLDPVAFLG